MPLDREAPRTAFLSYASEDRDLVLPVAHLLQAAGAQVWIDRDIPYGEEWEAALLGQLRAAERILVFWSIQAASSEWVRREYTIAIDAGLRVVPVPLDETPLPAELARFQALMELVPLLHRARRPVPLPPQMRDGSSEPSLRYIWVLLPVTGLLVIFAFSIRLSPSLPWKIEPPTALAYLPPKALALGALMMSFAILVLLLGSWAKRWLLKPRLLGKEHSPEVSFSSELEREVYRTVFNDLPSLSPDGSSP